MSGKKKYSKTGLVLVLVMVVCLLLVLAVIPGGIGDAGKDKDLDDENTPGIKTVVEEGTPIMIFDKRKSTRKLMQAFDDDAIASVYIVYNENDATYEAEITAPADIKKVYKALKNVIIARGAEGYEEDVHHQAMYPVEDGSVVIVGEVKASVVDQYNRIIFRLDDGSKSEFVFKGNDIFVGEETEETYYEIVNTEDLWQTVKEVTDV